MNKWPHRKEEKMYGVEVVCRLGMVPSLVYGAPGAHVVLFSGPKLGPVKI